MKQFLLLIFLLISLSAYAKTDASCFLVSGTVTQLANKPVYKFARASKYNKLGLPMTHTQFFIKTQDNKYYKIVVDNLFYNYISNAQALSNKDVGISNDFKRRFPVGSQVDACGKTYRAGAYTGINFVHPSFCTTTKFNGFLKINNQEITSYNRYCDDCACKNIRN